MRADLSPRPNRVNSVCSGGVIVGLNYICFTKGGCCSVNLLLKFDSLRGPLENVSVDEI